MELQSDTEQQIKKMMSLVEVWTSIQPTEFEISEKSENCVQKQLQIVESLNKLLSEVKKEGEKFGEDVKLLADFASSQKKFSPWIDGAEEKKRKGLKKPLSLEEAIELLNDAKKWQIETKDMKSIIEDGYTAATKMTSHDEPDQTYAAGIKRLTIIETTAKEWISKLESMITVWEKQTETAKKVTAAIAATPSGTTSTDMKLEDLEEHLNSLKQMFIEKQKMMDELDKQ